jgi:hypothetical protein
MTSQDFLLPIPAMETATDPIHSIADLRQRWRALMGELGFGERLLRFVFVGQDRCMVKMLGDYPIGRNPRPESIRRLMAALVELVTDAPEGTTVAFLLTRPGHGAITTADRGWATLLRHTAAEFGVPIEPVFRANDEWLVLVDAA